MFKELKNSHLMQIQFYQCLKP